MARDLSASQSLERASLRRPPGYIEEGPQRRLSTIHPRGRFRWLPGPTITEIEQSDVRGGPHLAHGRLAQCDSAARRSGAHAWVALKDGVNGDGFWGP